MTLEEMSKGIDLNKQLMECEEILESLKSRVAPSSVTLDGMPHTPGVSDKTGYLAVEIADLEEQCESLRVQIANEQEKAEAYISGMADYKCRTIFRLRFIHFMAWKEVADIMGKFYTEDSVKNVAYKRLKKLKQVST